jgi:Rrf2 family transcriptional regulator, nitric oxide-sensitive transcriptional repressor
MQLLFSTDLALRTLIRLSAEPDRHLSTETLARELCVSRNHLQKVVQSLSDAGFLRTFRGVKGGVMLAKPPGDIRVGAVVRHQERDQAIAECFSEDGNCTLVPCCRLKGVLKGAREAFYKHLDKVALSDCVTAATDILKLSAGGPA